MSDGSASLPVLDLADARSSEPAARARAEDAVRAGLGHYGLIYIRSHGLDTDGLGAFYDDFLALCARPEAEKQTWASGDIWYQRGSTPPNTEQAVIAGGQPHFKECFFIAPEPLDEELRDVYPEFYADNRWPNDSADFQRRYLALGRAIHAVGMEVLGVAATSLGLPADAFAGRTEGGPHVTRALRYLPLDAEQAADASLRAGESKDDAHAPSSARLASARSLLIHWRHTPDASWKCALGTIALTRRATRDENKRPRRKRGYCSPPTAHSEDHHDAEQPSARSRHPADLRPKPSCERDPTQAGRDLGQRRLHAEQDEVDAAQAGLQVA